MDIDLPPLAPYEHSAKTRQKNDEETLSKSTTKNGRNLVSGATVIEDKDWDEDSWLEFAKEIAPKVKKDNTDEDDDGPPPSVKIEKKKSVHFKKSLPAITTVDHFKREDDMQTSREAFREQWQREVEEEEEKSSDSEDSDSDNEASLAFRKTRGSSRATAELTSNDSIASTMSSLTVSTSLSKLEGFDLSFLSDENSVGAHSVYSDISSASKLNGNGPTEVNEHLTLLLIDYAAQLEGDIQKLREENEKLAQLLMENENTEQDQRAAQTKAISSSVTGEEDTLKAQTLDDYRRICLQHEAEIETLKFENATMEKKLMDMISEKKQLQSQITRLQQDQDGMEDQLTTLQHECGAFKLVETQLAETIDNLRADLVRSRGFAAAQTAARLAFDKQTQKEDSQPTSETIQTIQTTQTTSATEENLTHALEFNLAMKRIQQVSKENEALRQRLMEEKSLREEMGRQIDDLREAQNIGMLSDLGSPISPIAKDLEALRFFSSSSSTRSLSARSLDDRSPPLSPASASLQKNPVLQRKAFSSLSVKTGVDHSLSRTKSAFANGPVGYGKQADDKAWMKVGEYTFLVNPDASRFKVGQYTFLVDKPAKSPMQRTHSVKTPNMFYI